MSNIHCQAVIAIATQLLLDHIESKIHLDRHLNEDKPQYGAVTRHGSKTNISINTSFTSDVIQINSLSEFSNNHRWAVRDVNNCRGSELITFEPGTCIIQLPSQASEFYEPVICLKQDGVEHSFQLPKLCSKLYEALLKNNPQITSENDWDNILPTIAAGWRLVTIHNPHRLGLLDVWMVLRSEAADQYIKSNRKESTRRAA